MVRTAVLGRQGLIVLVGEGGTGKTVVAHALAVRVREEGVVVGPLLYPILEGMDLLGAVTEAFGLPADFKDRAEFVAQFHRFVAETAATGRRVLLIVDEAQRLSGDLLVELGRLPYADGPGGAASLTVLLVGQRGLLETLRASSVEPDVLCHLRPLTREQTAEYVTHRLRAAGHRSRLFTPPALRKIWVVSEGIPRAVNSLCVDALQYLPQTGRRKVTAAMVDRPQRPEPDAVAAEAPRPAPAMTAPEAPPAVPSSARSPVRSRRRVAVLASAAAVVLTLGATWGVTYSERLPWRFTVPKLTNVLTTTPPAPSSNDEASGQAGVVGVVTTRTALPERGERGDFPAPMVREPGEPTPSGAVLAPEPTAARAPEPAPTRALEPAAARAPEPAAARAQEPPAARPRPQPRPEAPPASPGGEESSDGSAIIDWLIKGRASDGKPIE
jgi:type II secretory pathway predicted ATPase ExeA